MKKNYRKPVLVKETFQLDAAVAGTCSGKGATTVNYSEDKCYLENGLFASEYCYINVLEQGDSNDGICYQSMVDINSFFAS